MTTFPIKQGDTAPALEVTLKDEMGMPVLLEGATARINARGVDGTILLDESVFIDPEQTGTVVYEWKPGDTDAPGVYRSEFVVTYADGSVETFPNKNYLTIYIMRDVLSNG